MLFEFGGYSSPPGPAIFSAPGHDAPMLSESSYDCPNCGEEIVVPVDPSAGREQEYVEDCPVCCCPILLRISIDAAGRVELRGESE